MIKKKLLVLNTTILLGVGSLVGIPTASAEDVNTQIQELTQDITKAQSELTELAQQIQRVEKALEDNNNLIAKTEKDIEATQNEVKVLEAEISVLKETIAKRTDVLKLRAQSYQETGGTVSYIEVLLGSEDFSDFIDRAFAVAQIANADKELINKHEADKAEVEQKQNAVKDKLANLNSMMEELEGMKALMTEQKEQNDALKVELEEKIQALTAEKSDLEAEKLRQLIAAQASVSSVSSVSGAKSTSGANYTYTAATYSGNVNDVIKAGYKYIGNSVYVFGGGRNSYDIANGRFDCSGFVHYAFSQAGIKVGASTDALKGQGKRVSVGEMRPGDLVFFDTYKRDGHVGIYVGGGKFIGSQSSTGVAIADMSSGYWKQKFNGRVNRIID
ncbi:coiled-coil domain-containing protein [Bacillus dakarensis]|uniref:coiled-coil domain-containing protein n=1 Tax=Robertmurraya dakarensis TaxID=1926278 RepID=UPI000981FF1A|nr:C40 family peptidase [Bacillus dakarensis]